MIDLPGCQAAIHGPSCVCHVHRGIYLCTCSGIWCCARARFLAGTGYWLGPISYQSRFPRQEELMLKLESPAFADPSLGLGQFRVVYSLQHGGLVAVEHTATTSPADGATSWRQHGLVRVVEVPDALCPASNAPPPIEREGVRFTCPKCSERITTMWGPEGASVVKVHYKPDACVKLSNATITPEAYTAAALLALAKPLDRLLRRLARGEVDRG